MKKIALWLLMAAVSFSLCACSEVPGTTQSAQSAAPDAIVPTVPETTAPPPVYRIAKETIIDGQYACTGVYSYNEAGQLIRIDRTYDEDGRPYDYELFEYDQKGNLILHETWFNEELMDSRYEYTYDASNRLIEGYDRVVDDNIWSWHEYCYDDNGRLEKRIARDRLTTKNSVVGEYRYSYTESGMVSREEFYTTDEVVTAYTEYTYDEQDRLIKKLEVTQNTNFNIQRTFTYSYDQNGLLIQCIRETCTDDITYNKAKITYIYEQV